MRELEGKNIIVTGSSSGIGAGTAVVLARHGANVVVNHRNSPEKADAVAKSVREQGSKAIVIQADVTVLAQVDQMMDRVIQEWQHIDALVNNVGHAYYKRIDELNPEDWYLSLDENLTSQIFCLQKILPHMVERGKGRIILLSSISAQRGSPSGDIAYTACKAGIVAMAKTLARSYAREGITVNSVAPGIIDAGLTDNMPAGATGTGSPSCPLGQAGYC